MNWFENWFNSKYYHILYKNRDHKEAVFFLDNIIKNININDGQILDVACGKGRHAKYLNHLGFNVTGIDISKNSIEFANRDCNENLKYFVHDMRSVFRKNHFDLVTNLFTSFGYFENQEDEQTTINAMSNNLKEGGLLLIDFMNVKKVISSLVKSESKEIDGGLFFFVYLCSFSKNFNRRYSRINKCNMKILDYFIRGILIKSNLLYILH